MCKTRWNYTLVEEFVSENSNCTLISTEFKTAKSKMVFKCSCGKEFETTFEHFRLRNKRQCNECGISSQLEKQSLSIEEVVKYVKEQSECNLLSDVYINSKSKLEFLCSCGTTFKKSFEKFKKSSMCKKCSYNQISLSQTFDYSYIKNYIELKNCKLKSEEYNGCYNTLEVICKCGEIYLVSFNSFKNENQIRCKKCSNKMSKGEIFIEEYLIKNKFNYIYQYGFQDLKANNDRHLLKFDFAVFLDNSLLCLIEFDGKQHKSPVEYFGGIESYEVLRNNDKKKNDYCSINNIKLIRIPYEEMSNIEQILNNSLIIKNDNTVPSLVIN